LWRDDRAAFECYQSLHATANRSKLIAPFWASFVGTPTDGTLFVGLYEVEYLGLLKKDTPRVHMEGTALKAAHGIYLLTCPKTKEQYVGKADGHDGFWGRWQQYVQSGHGGNTGLKSRDSSDYQVSILEVAGTATSANELNQMESLWKAKMQSRAMGLNRN
jgi:hypothetical protein